MKKEIKCRLMVIPLVFIFCFMGCLDPINTTPTPSIPSGGSGVEPVDPIDPVGPIDAPSINDPFKDNIYKDDSIYQYLFALDGTVPVYLDNGSPVKSYIYEYTYKDKILTFTKKRMTNSSYDSSDNHYLAEHAQDEREYEVPKKYYCEENNRGEMILEGYYTGDLGTTALVTFNYSSNDYNFVFDRYTNISISANGISFSIKTKVGNNEKRFIAVPISMEAGNFYDTTDYYNDDIELDSKIYGTYTMGTEGADDDDATVVFNFTSLPSELQNCGLETEKDYILTGPKSEKTTWEKVTIVSSPVSENNGDFTRPGRDGIYYNGERFPYTSEAYVPGATVVGESSYHSGIFNAGSTTIIDPFIMGRYEVTEQLYRAIMADQVVTTIYGFKYLLKRLEIIIKLKK